MAERTALVALYISCTSNQHHVSESSGWCKEGTNLQFLEVPRLVVHLDLERVDLEQLSPALGLVFAFCADGGGV